MAQTNETEKEIIRNEVNYIYSALLAVSGKAKLYGLPNDYIKELEKALDSLNEAETIYKNTEE